MRIDDVSPADYTNLGLGLADQSVSGKTLCVALSSDGTRAYVGCHSSIWRSDDGGNTWWHPEWPEPPALSFDVPGALPSLNVYDVAISPPNNDVVFAAPVTTRTVLIRAESTVRMTVHKAGRCGISSWIRSAATYFQSDSLSSQRMIRNSCSRRVA
jgi:hypothetical protein